MKSVLFGLALVASLTRAYAQETYQSTVALVTTNDPTVIFASGTVQLTGHRLLVQFGMPSCVGVAGIYGPAGFGTNAPQLISLPVFPRRSHNGPAPACSCGGEFQLTDEQTAQVRGGLWYVQMDAFRGQIVFDRICRFMATNEIEFAATIDGWNPTNRSPRYLRFGRAQLGLTGDVLSYEIQMPAQYGPYYVAIKEHTGYGGFYFDPALIGTTDCLPVSSTPTPSDAADLEFLPACVMRGAVCVPPSLIADLLAGRWTLMFNSQDAWGGIVPVDTDHDGIPDHRDGCPNTPSGAVVNADGCSIEQLAPCEGPWRNHGDYVKRVKAVSEDFVKAGLITEVQRRLLLTQATKSHCGKR